MRSALAAHVAPSRYLRHLGLDHLQEHGETDALLVMAVHYLDSLLCPCGCGQYADVAHDPDTDGWWEVDTDTVCYAGAALAQWREDKGPEQMDPGALVRVVLDPEFYSVRDRR